MSIEYRVWNLCEVPSAERNPNANAHRRNRWEVFPNEAVQWMPMVVRVTDPLPGLVRMRPLLCWRVTLTRPSAAWIMRKPLMSYISVPSSAQLYDDLAITSCASGTNEGPWRESLLNLHLNRVLSLHRIPDILTHKTLPEYNPWSGQWKCRLWCVYQRCPPDKSKHKTRW